MSVRPCATFVPPKDKLYPAFCEHCSFSRAAHLEWDNWEEGIIHHGPPQVPNR